MTETCPSTRWADAGGGSCTDTPRGDTCWRSVGPHGECGFDAGGLPARFRKRPRAGALRSAGTRAAQRRSLRREARRRVGCPWIPFRSECEGMRRDQSSPGHFHKFQRKFAIMPPPRRGRCEGGRPSRMDWGRCLGRRGIPADSGLGTGYPDGREGGTEANRGITTPLHPDTRLNASQDGF
jgi:hypothetical protein